MTTARIVSVRLLEAVLNSPHALALGSGHDTHEPALRLSWLLVSHITDKAFIEAIVRALLPVNYAGNTLQELSGMIDEALTKTSHQPEAKSRDSVAIQALKMATAGGMELFHDPLGEPFAAVTEPGGHRSNIPVYSSRLSQYLRFLYEQRTGRGMGKTAVTETIEMLAARATFQGPEEKIHIRLAGHDDEIYVDLGRADNQVVHISASGWEMTTHCPVRFWRPHGFGEMPVPERDGDLASLATLLNLDRESEPLTLAYLISCMNPAGPYFSLIVQGEQGSGKSFLCSVVKRIVDPAAIEKLRLPKTEHDLAIQAAENRMLVYDNASGMKWDISDALCAVATGAGFSTRRYYTDNESRTFKHMRPIVINGIGDFVNRPDLLERSILVKLKAMPEHTRRPERELEAEFARILPGLLGCLFDCAARALKDQAHTAPPTSIRMADAALWLVAAEPATDLRPGTFLRALEGVQRGMMVDRAINDPLIIAILRLLADQPGSRFTGTVGDLHVRLANPNDPYNRHLPGTPAHLSNALQRLNPVMAKIGLHVEFGQRTRAGKLVTLRLDPEHPEIETGGRSPHAEF